MKSPSSGIWLRCAVWTSKHTPCTLPQQLHKLHSLHARGYQTGRSVFPDLQSLLLWASCVAIPCCKAGTQRPKCARMRAHLPGQLLPSALVRAHPVWPLLVPSVASNLVTCCFPAPCFVGIQFGHWLFPITLAPCVPGLAAIVSLSAVASLPSSGLLLGAPVHSSVHSMLARMQYRLLFRRAHCAVWSGPRLISKALQSTAATCFHVVGAR